jgi:hypothetical protein
MIWLTWRQFRGQALAAAAALAAFAILLAATGPHLTSLYAASGITGCHGGGCANAATDFLGRLRGSSEYLAVYMIGVALILAAPAIIGIFWGAPLIAREFEAGTHRLAWNQSVTRTRWLAVKLTLTGLAAVAVTEALSLMQAWWAAPIGRATGLGGSANLLDGGRFSYLIFASHGVTPLGYAAFGFALGTAAGALIRRTVPAMAVTLAIFAAIQVAMPLWVRPYLIPPDHTVASFQAVQADSVGTLTPTVVPGHPGAWIVSTGAVDASGRPVSVLASPCFTAAPEGAKSMGGVAPIWQCLAGRGIRATVSYQPAGRYWDLEWIETGIFGVLAVTLAGSCFWWLSRRRT